MATIAASENFPRKPGMSHFGVRRAKAAFLSGCKSHPAILLQPEAIGAVMEVTKWLKPLV
jgi:hypothetical protein